MNSAVVLSLALFATGAPVPKDIAPTGPAPYALKTDAGEGGAVRVEMRIRVPDGGRVVIQNRTRGVKTVEYDTFVMKDVQVTLAEIDDLKVYSADGEELNQKAAAAKLTGGATAVASADGRKPDTIYLRALKPGTLVLVAPDLVKDKPAGYGPSGRPLLEVKHSPLFWAMAVPPPAMPPAAPAAAPKK